MVEQLEKDYAGKVKIVAMDVDRGQEVAGALGVMSIPTVIFFKDGQEVARIVGALPRQRFVDEIKARYGV